MREKIAIGGLLAALLFSAMPAVARAESTATWTAIYVTDMHCDACAKKIARKLYALPGVKEVKANVPKDLAFVVPETGKNCSPRSIWEAVEQAGFEPVKLVGPGGTFTTKPQQ